MSFRGQSTKPYSKNRHSNWRNKPQAVRLPQNPEVKAEAPKTLPAIQYVNLGQNLKISQLGLGCMAMSEFYGASDEEKCIQVIRRAVELGVNFLDTADIYGFGANEELLAKALKDIPRDKVVIATKGGIVRKKDDPTARGVNNKPEYIKACVEASLKRLGTDYIDLYYLHRLDSNTPIEEAMAALVELVKAGKIRHIGLSEADAKIIRRAHQIHPITAVQTEYSLWTRFVENNEVLRVCRDLNIGFVPYSPLGRGLLTGKINNPDKLEEKDYRRSIPRFQVEHIQGNFENLEPVVKLAKEKGCTPAQIVLAWIFAQGHYFRQIMVPIPGTRNIKYLEENIAALGVRFSKEELKSLHQLRNSVSGERYPQAAMDLYHLHPSIPSPDLHPTIFSFFKIILSTHALQGRDLSGSYSKSKKQEYPRLIKEANPDEVNAFLRDLLIRRPVKSMHTGRNVATVFVEALLDLGIFDLIFPEISNRLLRVEDRYYAILKRIDDIVEKIAQGRLAENQALGAFYHQLIELSGRNYVNVITSNRFFNAFYAKPMAESAFQYLPKPKVGEDKSSLEAKPASNRPQRPLIFTVFDKIWADYAWKEKELPVSISASKRRLYQEQLAACPPNEINAYIHSLLIAAPLYSVKTNSLVANNFFQGLNELGIFQLLFPEINYDFFSQRVANIVTSVKRKAIDSKLAIHYLYGQLIHFSGLDQAILSRQNRLFAAFYGLPQLQPVQVTQTYTTNNILQGLVQLAAQVVANQPMQQINYLPQGQQPMIASNQQQGQWVTQGGVNMYPRQHGGYGPRGLRVEIPNDQAEGQIKLTQ